MNYAGTLSAKNTPQTEPMLGSNQVENNAGGFTFAVDMWTRLDRFLILGAEGGSYYVGEKALVKENAFYVIEAIQTDGVRVVNRTVEISQAGRAPKNDPAIFVLALAATYGDAATKAAAYNGIHSVCRIGTHIFQFCEQIQALRGWSRGLRTGVGKFYTNRNADQIAFQAIKYRNRNGFTHRDVLRLAHPSGNKEQSAVFEYIVKRDASKPYEIPLNSVVAAFEAAQKATNSKDLVDLVRVADLPWEAIPTEFLNDKDVWEALLPSMGITALLRNLGKMTKLGLFDGSRLNKNTTYVIKTLTDATIIEKSRLHPVTILIGMKTYAAGKGFKGSLVWTPQESIVDALDKAFYLAFKNVTPTGKRFLIGLDVSGSMSSPINGSNLTSREATTALAMITAATESQYAIMAFSDTFVELPISPGQRLDKIMKLTERLPFQATDCSLPIEYAIENRLLVDVFMVFTDNETYTGKRHPVQALAEYRKKFNKNAKMIVLATAPNGFSIADPNDSGMLDISGFDSSVPAIIAEFVR